MDKVFDMLYFYRFWIIALSIAILYIIVEALIIRRLRRRVNLLKPKYHLTKYRKKFLGLHKMNLKLLDQLDGIQFENLCCEILNALGYSNIRKTRTTGDFGLDIICDKDGLRYGIQCKCYSSTIGLDAVQQAFAGCAYYKCDVPVVMTNNYFTDASQELARVIGVTLWSRNFFIDKVEYLKRHR